MLATLIACEADAMTEAVAMVASGVEELTMVSVVEDWAPRVFMTRKGLR